MPRQFRPRKDQSISIACSRPAATPGRRWGCPSRSTSKRSRRPSGGRWSSSSAGRRLHRGAHPLEQEPRQEWLHDGASLPAGLAALQLGRRGLEPVVRVLAVILVLALGWGLARSVGSFVGPTFMRRMDPATAGTFGFLIRLITMAIALLLALSVAGASLQSLAVGGAFTAVIVGLAAQQTLGNVIAGMVLLSARPFRVGERVRLQAGAVGGQVEGIVSSLGLLYTTLTARRRPDHDPQQRRCWPPRWCRCASRTRSTSRCGSPPASGPARSRRSSIRRSRPPPAAAPRCCSRRSTATMWWSASRPRPRCPTRAPSWPTRSWPRCPRSPASTRPPPPAPH